MGKWRAWHTLGVVALIIACAIAWRDTIPIRWTILGIVVVVIFGIGKRIVYSFRLKVRWDNIWLERRGRYQVDGTFLTQDGRRISYNLRADEPHANYGLNADGQAKIELAPKPPKISPTLPELLRELWGHEDKDT